MTGPSAHRGRRDNGLSCDQFSPVADVDPRLADHLLDVLLLREVPAYVEPAPMAAARLADRLYVAADRTNAARELLTQLASELGIEVSHEGPPSSDGGDQSTSEDSGPRTGRAHDDPLLGVDTDAEFRAIVAGFDLDAEGAVGTDAAARNESLTRPLFDPLTSPSVQATTSNIDDTVEHFIPPPPPPLPVPEPRTAMAWLLALLGVFVMAFGDVVGFGFDIAFPLGVVLVLTGGGLLVMQLRPDRSEDDGDDGAVV